MLNGSSHPAWKGFNILPMQIELCCPAKINLLLAVTGRRGDGFHDLISLVAPLEFGDTLRLSRSPNNRGIRLRTEGIELSEGADNLAWRAAEGFFDRFGIEEGLDIEIVKRIPIGAGLGGGSSDAAGVLRGLSALFGIDDGKALLELAAGLGSDCPLFLNGKPLIMRGRGEELEPLGGPCRQSLVGTSVALFKPSFGISTVWAYKALAAKRSCYASADDVENVLDRWRNGDLPLPDLLENSFDSVVGAKYPGIPLLLERISDDTGCRGLMSGSGSACFALGSSHEYGRIKEIVRECWGEQAFFQETTITDIGLTEYPSISS